MYVRMYIYINISAKALLLIDFSFCEWNMEAIKNADRFELSHKYLYINGAQQNLPTIFEISDCRYSVKLIKPKIMQI